MKSNNCLHFPISNTLEPYTKEQYPESRSVGSILVGGFIRVISTAAYGIGFILDVVLSPLINLASCLNVLKKPASQNSAQVRGPSNTPHSPPANLQEKTLKVKKSVTILDPLKLKNGEDLSKKNPTQKTQATPVIPSHIKSTESSRIKDSIEKTIDQDPEPVKEEGKHSDTQEKPSDNPESTKSEPTPIENAKPPLQNPTMTGAPNSSEAPKTQKSALTENPIKKTIDQNPEPVKEEGKHSDTQEKPSDNPESTKAETTLIKNPAIPSLQGTEKPPIVIDAIEPIDEVPEDTPQPNSTFRTALKVFAVSAFIGVGVYAYYQNSSSQQSSITEDSTSRSIISQSSNLLRTVVQNRFLSFIPSLWSSFSQIPEYFAKKAESEEFHNAMRMSRYHFIDVFYPKAISLINEALKQNGNLKAVEARILYNMKIKDCWMPRTREKCFEKVRQEIQQDTDTIAAYLTPKRVDMCLPGRDIDTAIFISGHTGQGTPYSIQKLLTQENGRYRNALHIISWGIAANLTRFNTGTGLPLLKTVFDKAGLKWKSGVKWR